MAKPLKALLLGAVGVWATAVGGLCARILTDRSLTRLEQRLAPTPTGLKFDESMLAGLPDPAQRYLRHAIEPGTPLARSVRIGMTGRMKPSPDAKFVELQANERLTPERGFCWDARTSMYGIPLRVIDRYEQSRAEVSVRLFGFLPMRTERGDDVARSTRGRIAGESVWIPSLLLPVMGAEWEAIDDRRARVTVTADRERIPLTLHVDDDGALLEIKMMRHGDIGVEKFQALPYGFFVQEEATFSGYRIPASIRGGWWYGTGRYEEERAATFTVRSAEYL